MSARFDRRSVLTVLSVLLLSAASALPAAAQCDNSPPVVTSFTLSPTSVNTTLGPQDVTCTMALTDAPAGVASAGCILQWTDGVSLFQTQGCSSTAPISGTPQNGTWQCTITLPRYSAQGTWNVAQVSVADAVTNAQSYLSFQLPPGSTTFITVTSDSDLIAPALTSSSLSPTSVNVSDADKDSTCNMTVTDAKSGVAVAGCTVTGPASVPPAEQQSRGCTANIPASGTRTNGTFRCPIKIPRYSDAGAWTTQVVLIDQVGNFSTPAAIPTLAVTAVPEDVLDPVLGAFDFNPKSVNAANGPSVVTCTIPVTDALSGVASAGCSFSFFDFTTFVTETQSCTATSPSSGTRNNGTFSCQVTIPRYSDPGSWTTQVDVEDNVGNSITSNPATPLTVTCSASGDPEATIRFQLGSRTTLVWDVVTGATRYNVYKGSVPQLPGPPVDYGTCQNLTDPNLTDTQFVDNAIPNSTQKGFHYLVSYTSGGVEKGLGKQSDETPRSVIEPCP